MKRFIRYLYEYEQAKRKRNVGFVKVEAGNEATIVHMQGKGFHNSDDRKLVLYLFYEENGKLHVIRQEEMELKTPAFNWHFRYDAEKYDRINGVLIETAGGRRFAATWDDQPVDVSRVEEETGELAVDEEEVPEELAVSEEEEEGGSQVQEKVEMGPVELRVDREEGKSEPNDSLRKLRKIQRKDISGLPRCEWRLANNQFLIYGFNNYHHLLLVEEGNVLKLGVPGIYHIEEAKCAESFGFGEFLPIEEIDISLDREEKHQDESFGYWCRPVRGNRKRR